jgi:iron complex transport system substrate-binding protein
LVNMHAAGTRHVWALLAAVACAAPAIAAPQHVVSVNICTDEYVYRLLPRQRIAALSFLAADRHPVISTIADKVSGITLVHPSAETVIALHPDLVVAYQGVNQNLHALLARAGVKVLDVPYANSLDDIRKTTRMLGEALGEAARASELIAQMDRELAVAHADTKIPTVIYEPNGYATADGVSDTIMADAGLRDVAPRFHQTRLGDIPLETLIASPPALLILNDAKEASPARADMLLQSPALAAIRGQTLIAHLSLTPLLCPGPWSADAAAPLAKLGKAARLRANTTSPKS